MGHANMMTRDCSWPQRRAADRARLSWKVAVAAAAEKAKASLGCPFMPRRWKLAGLGSVHELAADELAVVVHLIVAAGLARTQTKD